MTGKLGAETDCLLAVRFGKGEAKHVLVSTTADNRVALPDSFWEDGEEEKAWGSNLETILICVALHGNEDCGVVAINDMLEAGYFSGPLREEGCLPEHTLVTVILGNVEAFLQDVRSVPGGMNMNRCFKAVLMADPTNYEAQRCKLITHELRRHDIIFDVHSTSGACPSFAIPAGDAYSERLAHHLPLDVVVPELAHRLVERGATLDLALDLGKPGIAVECGRTHDPACNPVAREIIETFLHLHTHHYFHDEKTEFKKELYIQERGYGPDRTPEKFPDRCKLVRAAEAVEVKEEFAFMRTFKCFGDVLPGEEVYRDVAGVHSCPYPTACVIMPTAAPVLGEEAFFWGVLEDSVKNKAYYQQLKEMFLTEEQYPL